jgi:TPP-dependent 2-oxoacid decarboxylase
MTKLTLPQIQKAKALQKKIKTLQYQLRILAKQGHIDFGLKREQQSLQRQLRKIVLHGSVGTAKAAVFKYKYRKAAKKRRSVSSGGGGGPVFPPNQKPPKF